MNYEATCECGWHTSGLKDDVVTLIIEHGKDVHGMAVTTDQALAQMKPVDA